VFATGLVVCLTGLLLLQLPGLPQIPTRTLSRGVIYWLHGLAPVAAIVLYVLHTAGPAPTSSGGGASAGPSPSASSSSS